MSADENRAESVDSAHHGKRIALTGFELAERYAHMIAWLGRGRDCREFIIPDVEQELYGQQPGSQLLSVEMGEPEAETDVRGDVVTGLRMNFPLALRVEDNLSSIWKLDVMLGYRLESQGGGLTLSFRVLKAAVE